MKKSRKTPVGVLNGNWRAGDYVAYRRQIEADAQRQIRVDALLAEERQLMEKCHDLEGDEFIAWYDSDAVPAYGVIQERINLLKQRIASLTETQDPAQALDGTEPSPIISGGEILYPNSTPSRAMQDDKFPF
jgi:hypothetical protein